MTIQYRSIIRDGLWDNNIVFGQMIGLCPAMAVTTSATNGLGMGLCTTFVVIATNTLISSCRHIISPEVRLGVFVLMIATFVSLVDMVVNAWLHELYKVLGLFIPLIVVNCSVLARAEVFASRQPVADSALDGLMMGLGFTLALVILGGCREILGSATLFANASLLLGQPFAFLELTFVQDYKGFLLMLLPPGGFLVLGFLMAGKRLIDIQLKKRVAPKVPVFADQQTAS